MKLKDILGVIHYGEFTINSKGGSELKVISRGVNNYTITNIHYKFDFTFEEILDTEFYISHTEGLYFDDSTEDTLRLLSVVIKGGDPFIKLSLEHVHRASGDIIISYKDLEFLKSIRMLG